MTVAPVVEHIARSYARTAVGTVDTSTGELTSSIDAVLGKIVASHIYQHVHAQMPIAVTNRDPDPSFVAPMREAFYEQTYLDGGWRLEVARPQTVTKDGLALWSPTPLATPQLSGEISIELPCERMGLVPGCYIKIGRAGPVQGRPASRIYAHVASERANLALIDLCSALDSRGVRFTAKTFVSASLCRRVDTLVVEVARTAQSEVASIVRGALMGVARAGSPGFARSLGGGLAVSESDNTGSTESFGQSRSRVAAEGILCAGGATFAGRVESIAAAFGRAGLCAATPCSACQTTKPRPAP